jgi:chromosome partitioning protein
MENYNMTTSNNPFVIVMGNEKGGTGKSTLSMHILVHLLRMGFKVGSIDVDARQGTFSRYLENRETHSKNHNLNLVMPQHISLNRSTLDNRPEAEAEDRENTANVMKGLSANDFIVIDTPGNDTYISRLAHSYANVIITPVNDSFIDLDVLMKIKDLEKNQISPSHYAEMVWNQKKERLIRDKVTIDWIVIRNRLSNLASRNKEEMWRVLQLLSKRIGFRVGEGFAERVIFRELFLTGMTVLDLEDTGQVLTLSHVAARQELRSLLNMLNLPQLEDRLQIAC